MAEADPAISQADLQGLEDSAPPAPLLLKNERTGFDGSGSAALAPKQQPIT